MARRTSPNEGKELHRAMVAETEAALRRAKVFTVFPHDQHPLADGPRVADLECTMDGIGAIQIEVECSTKDDLQELVRKVRRATPDRCAFVIGFDELDAVASGEIRAFHEKIRHKLDALGDERFFTWALTVTGQLWHFEDGYEAPCPIDHLVGQRAPPPRPFDRFAAIRDDEVLLPAFLALSLVSEAAGGCDATPQNVARHELELKAAALHLLAGIVHEFGLAYDSSSGAGRVGGLTINQLLDQSPLGTIYGGSPFKTLAQRLRTKTEKTLDGAGIFVSTKSLARIWLASAGLAAGEEEVRDWISGKGAVVGARYAVVKNMLTRLDLTVSDTQQDERGVRVRESRVDVLVRGDGRFKAPELARAELRLAMVAQVADSEARRSEATGIPPVGEVPAFSTDKERVVELVLENVLKRLGGEDEFLLDYAAAQAVFLVRTIGLARDLKAEDGRRWGMHNLPLDDLFAVANSAALPLSLRGPELAGDLDLLERLLRSKLRCTDVPIADLAPMLEAKRLDLRGAIAYMCSQGGAGWVRKNNREYLRTDPIAAWKLRDELRIELCRMDRPIVE